MIDDEVLRFFHVACEEEALLNVLPLIFVE